LIQQEILKIYFETLQIFKIHHLFYLLKDIKKGLKKLWKIKKGVEKYFIL